MTDLALRKNFLQAVLLSLLALFAIPLLTWVFANHALHQDDTEFLQRIESRIHADTRLAPAETQTAIDFYRAHPPSTMCESDDPETQRYRDGVCGRFGEIWQFNVVRSLAFWTLVGGAVVLLAIAALGAMAFVNRPLQYLSFASGWHFMTLASALEITAQGAMCVWLSFWLMAYYSHEYSPKLVIAVGVCVLIAAAVIVMKIFHRAERGNVVAGELISEADAPRLWQRIRQMAERLKTTPPDHLVAGIDANFFVTEAPLSVGGRTLEGRKLFVSIPLLQQLGVEEADAVLGHELAHLSGGDARSSAALGPKLMQYDIYLQHIRAGGLSRVVHPFLLLFRMIFQLALARDSRTREFKADSAAAQLVSPEAISRSLVKIAAYANYRADTEARLFGRDQKLGEQLGIAGSVAQGLRPWAASAEFAGAMTTAAVPHPYDSHPPMRERMANVGHAVPEADYAAIVSLQPEATWVDDIGTAAAVEERLWAAYEKQFARDHEMNLAYRYEPANDEERALVLAYFPPQSFKLKGDRTIEVNYTGIQPPLGAAPIPWDAVKGLKFRSGNFGDALVVTLHEKGLIGAKTVKIKVGGLRKDKARFQKMLVHYWQRHQFMRAYQQRAERNPN
jgi:Zn-dependent protease with chaperone function